MDEKEQVLMLMVGLPRSGKSTWARLSGYPIVSRDSIRLSIHGHRYIQSAEEVVAMVETTMVNSLFLSGHEFVIVDATHMSSEKIKRWDRVSRGRWRIMYVIVPTDAEECQFRAMNDNMPDLVDVIDRMRSNTDFDFTYVDDVTIVYSMDRYIISDD